jgi:hypothetical protein
MKLIQTLVAFGVLAVAADVASAQPGGYYAPQPGYAPAPQQLPGGFHRRGGRIIFGGNVGLGGMSLNGQDLDCVDCNYGTLSLQLAGHIGGFVGPRLALMAELQGNFQTLSSDRFTGDTTTLVQGALMFAGQYWLTPQLWVKGGIGVSNLRTERSYYGDGVIDEVQEVPENGLAVMGAVGYELFSAPRFSVDLQGRIINGSYDQTDNNVSAASIGIGVNWF